MNIRIDCSTDIAIKLLSAPDVTPWARLHAFKVVGTEANTFTFVGYWPHVYDHAATPETGRLRCRKSGKAKK